MRFLVPFEASRPKTRLDPVLDADERAAFARAMLRDVLGALRATSHAPEVVATAPVDGNLDNVPTSVDDRPLSAAINARLGGTDPVGVLVADLGLVTPTAVETLVEAAADGDVVVAPGRGGGTNGLVVSHPDFQVDFHGVSYRDHLTVARAVGVEPRVVDSMRLASDVDEPADLVEVLLHGEGEAAAWLREAGFELDAGEGRVGIDRTA
ncbi:2-phospho-L-lactate guanylyltransferase [Haloplanus pelagicus]|jgi:2-phospho-L-lactate guanylyltransferase|uniref:2-phospho-L-lactate guanylyltransferase n=1 Tax=Haloplanus pelagicus TaxID=2949995 RepID=UPI0020425A06|nr:2-phospho-L-lactate guanylyltransferase [Haloplanus sp. HW8-1]